jgi:hypothetical protein
MKAYALDDSYGLGAAASTAWLLTPRILSRCKMD